MSGHFTIRPKPMPWESLTGYLIRVARLNQVNLYQVINTIFNQEYRCGATEWFKLDTLPESSFDMKRLSSLTGLSQETLFSMSLMPLQNKLYEDSQTESVHIISRHLNKKTRNICPKCLSQDGVFRLIWQVNEIILCNIHHEKLRNSCAKCESDYPYLSSKYMDYVCPTCSETMFEHLDGDSPDQEVVEEQLFWYGVWHYVLQTEQPVVNAIEGYTKEDSALIALLWLVPRGDLELYRNNVCNLVAHGKKPISARRLTLPNLMIILRENGISLEHFANIQIPVDKVFSILHVERQKTESGPCLASWCSSFGKNTAMKKPKIQNVTVNQYSVCADCFIHYGYGRNDGGWRDVGGIVDLIWNVIRPLLEMGYTKEQLYGEMVGKENSHKLDRIIGYLSSRKLLSEHISKEYTPTGHASELVNCFKKLIEQTRTEKGMVKVAKSSFGWDRAHFYYYFFSPEVQELLLFGETRKIEGREYAQDTWRVRVKNVIEEFKQNEEVITLKKIAQALGTNTVRLSKHGLHHMVSQAAQEQRGSMIKKEQDMIKMTVQEFLETLSQNNEGATYQDVYSFLGISASRFHKSHSDIKEWLGQQLDVHNANVRQCRLEKYKEDIQEAIKFFRENQMPVTIKGIFKHCTLVSTTIRDKYPEVLELIKLNL